MTEHRLYMQVEDVFVPIGVAEARPTAPGYINISGQLDVFPGAKLNFSRIVNWEEFLTHARALYPEGFIMTKKPDVDALYREAEAHMLKHQHNNLNGCNAAGCPGCVLDHDNG